LRAYSVDSTGTMVQNSTFHHFRNSAIKLDGGRPVEIAGCTIRRGANLSSQFGNQGIDIHACSPYIHGNTIEAMAFPRFDGHTVQATYWSPGGVSWESEAVGSRRSSSSRRSG
jgi:hypothetical protein